MKAEIIPKGMQFAVLRAIPVLGPLRACGTEIHHYLEKVLDREIPSAQVYMVLKRLHAQGFVERTTETERPAGRRGYPRRIYTLSTTGQQAYEAGMRLFGIPDNSGGAHEEQRGAVTSSVPT